MTSNPIQPPLKFQNLYLFQKVFNFLSRNHQIKLLKSIPQYQLLIKDQNEEEHHLSYDRNLTWNENLYPVLPMIKPNPNNNDCYGTYIPRKDTSTDNSVIGGYSMIGGGYSAVLGNGTTVSVGRYSHVPRPSFSHSSFMGTGNFYVQDRPNSKEIIIHASNLTINQSEYSRFEKSTIQGSSINITIQPFAVVKYVIITGHDLNITFTSHKTHEGYNIQTNNQSLIY